MLLLILVPRLVLPLACSATALRSHAPGTCLMSDVFVHARWGEDTQGEVRQASMCRSQSSVQAEHQSATRHQATPCLMPSVQDMPGYRARLHCKLSIIPLPGC